MGTCDGQAGAVSAQSALRGGPPKPREPGPCGMWLFQRGLSAIPQGLSFQGFANLAGGPTKHTLCKRKKESERKEEKTKRKKEEKQVTMGRPHHLERKSR